MNEKITFDELPQRASEIFTIEYHQVLKEGYEVMDSDGDAIYKIFPNGEKEFVKSVKSYKVTSKKIKLKW